MNNNYFSINQQNFKIEFYSVSKSYELQNRIFKVVNNELQNLMNDYFDEVVPKELIFKIDSIELNIGDVTYDNLEKEIVSKFMDALKKEFDERFKLALDPAFNQQSGVVVTKTHDGKIDLIEYFLLTGRFPWWARWSTDIEDTLIDLFNTQRSSLRQLILKVGKFEYVRRRIVNRFYGKYMRLIIETLEPQEVDYIFGYHKAIVKVQKEEKIVTAEQAEFEKTIWLFILDYLLADRGGQFNRKSFVKITLKQIASNYNISYFDLLHILFNAMKLQQNLKYNISSLEIVIKEIANEDETFSELENKRLADNNIEVYNTEILDAVRKFDLIRYYLSYGSFPSNTKPYSKTQLEKIINDLASNFRQPFLDLLIEVVDKKNVIERLFLLIGETGAKKIFEIIFPKYYKKLSVFVSTFEMLNNKNAFSISPIKSFKVDLWKVIFEVYLVSKFTILDDKVLIQSLLKGIQIKYNLNSTKYFEDITKAINSGIFNSAIYLEHISLIQSILEGHQNDIENYNQYSVLNFEDISNVNLDAAYNLSIEVVSLKDVLRFLITYGSLPWWGKHLQVESPLSLFLKLQELSATESLLIFKFSGTRKLTQNRFLEQIPVNIIIDIFQRFPEGHKTVQFFEQFTIILKLIDSNIPSKWLIQIFWDELISHNYQFVTETGLFLRFIMRLSLIQFKSPLEVNIDLLKLLAGWKGDAISNISYILNKLNDLFLDENLNDANGIKNSDLLNMIDFSNQINFSKQAFKERGKLISRKGIDYILQEHLFSSYAMLIPPKGTSEVDIIKDWLVTADPNIGYSFTNKIFTILNSFIETGHLPDNIRILENEVINVFIKRLIILAFKIDDDRLVLLLQKNQGAFAIPHIFKLINESSGGDEKLVAEALLPIFEKYSYPFSIIKKDVSADVFINSNDIEKIFKLYLNSENVTSEYILGSATQVLQYYLLWNKLPDNLLSLISNNFNHFEFIKSLLYYILEKDSNLPINILNNIENLNSSLETVQSIIYSLSNKLSPNVLSSINLSIASLIKREPEYFLTTPTQDKEIAFSQNADIKMIINGYLNEEYNTVLNNEKVLNAAIEIIQYFLLWNRFPDKFLNIVPININYSFIMKELFLIIYRKDKLLLNNTLNLLNLNIIALKTLYLSFSTLLSNEDLQIVNLIKDLIEAHHPKQNSNNIITPIISASEDFNSSLSKEISNYSVTIVEKILKEQLNRALVDSIILNDKIVYFISEKLDILFFNTVIEKSGYRPFNEYLNVSNDLILIFNKAFSDSLLREKVISLFKRFNLELAAKRETIQYSSDYIIKYFKYLQQYQNISNEAFNQILFYLEKVSYTFLPAISKEIPFIKKGLRILLNQLDELKSIESYKFKQVTPIIQNSNDSIDSDKFDIKLYNKLLDEISNNNLKKEDEIKRDNIEKLNLKNKIIYISNSGLVLLHPFFNFYLNSLGLIENGKFINLVSQIHAILLMQYLVTGRTKYDEHELVLNKILCQFPLEETVPLEFEPTQKEIDLSLELFDVLKNRWDKVKNSSLEGIRSSFLLREGAIRETEDGWNLRVEQRGYDMLLQTMPWAFGFIKLPWMNKILIVEWI